MTTMTNRKTKAWSVRLGCVSEPTPACLSVAAVKRIEMMAENANRKITIIIILMDELWCSISNKSRGIGNLLIIILMQSILVSTN